MADGGMGTMLQAAGPTLEDMQGHDGCNEVLNVTRPDIVRAVHEEYLATGCDAIETNTFGANTANLGEYGISDRIRELAEAGARVAREAADAWSTPEHPRWVIGSIGPGTKLPSLGHAPFAVLRDGYFEQVCGLVAGGVDMLLVETVQDLLQAKAAILGARRAMAESGARLPVYVQITVETTGTMLLGTETPAALTVLRGLGVDGIGLNCATGPAEMGEHLRQLSRHADTGLSVMPNAGLPQLTSDGAYYPLSPGELADAHDSFTAELGFGLVGGCCGTTPEHIAAVVDRVRGRDLRPRRPRPEPGVASLYTHVPFRQDTAFLAIGERTNANGSRAFRDAMLESRWDDLVDIARAQNRDGAHLLDVSVDYVGRDGGADVEAVVSRLATASTLPLVIDSTEPEVIRRGLELVGGRAMVNSVNYEDGDGPDSRFARIMPIVREHGAAVVALVIDETGQARTAEHKVAVAERLIVDLTQSWGMAEHDIVVDMLTFPISTGQEETRRDGIETLEAIRRLKQAHPDVNTTLGVSNVSFGLSPAARVVLNSVFLHEAVKAGLDSAIVHAARIVPLSRIPDDQLQVAMDLIHDRRREGYDPLQALLETFDGVSTADQKAERAAELLALPLGERLSRRIVDGERNGLEADLDEAIARGSTALEIINDHLLAGMRVVGELFGKGEMQLPFVLTSAEVMKTAVAHLEPHIEKTGDDGRGTIVLATVKGDVHDIGKNLVDIILTNNGYTVVNLGIKQPVSEILRAATEHRADAVGMSGLLVKSTVIMKENLEEMNSRGIAADLPVLLGGAALTRAYVENDLAELYHGEVRYARDAFEGLRLMDAVMRVKRGQDAALPAPRARRVPTRAATPAAEPDVDPNRRSDVDPDVDVPEPPFWGTRVVRGIPVADYLGYLDERATFLGQWGLTGSRGDGPGYDELVETEGRPRLRMWLDRIHTDGLLEAGVVYGHLPVASEGNDLCVLASPTSDEVVARWTFPRQRRDRRLCLADFHKSMDWVQANGRPDVLGVQLVTMGSRVAEATAKLFAADAYRDYLELHGLSVQLTEALAERWHARIREELGLATEDSPDLDGILRQGYRGSRYSFGYPACPDLEHRVDLVRLLEPDRIGVELSEELQLHPEQSTDAIVVHHPEAKYFNAT